MTGKESEEELVEQLVREIEVGKAHVGQVQALDYVCQKYKNHQVDEIE